MEARKGRFANVSVLVTEHVWVNNKPSLSGFYYTNYEKRNYQKSVLVRSTFIR